jgi:hypothetical protein
LEINLLAGLYLGEDEVGVTLETVGASDEPSTETVA